jgi:hypothetical protein
MEGGSFSLIPELIIPFVFIEIRELARYIRILP